MPMTAPPHRDAFGDPKTGFVYPWPRNHTEEQGAAMIRQIDNMQPMRARWANVRAIRTQGGKDATVYKLGGRIVNLAQHEAFLAFLDISLLHTIYFFHYAGEKFECQLSDYEPERQPDRGHREKYRWVYSIQLDVIQRF